MDSFLSCDFLFEDSSETVIQIRKVTLQCHDRNVYEKVPEEEFWENKGFLENLVF